MTTKPIIVRDLFFSYGNSLILENINFECNMGEFVAIVGKSGVGKSSLLKVLAQFEKSKGEIIISNNIGYVFQSYSLFPWMTLEENVEFALSGISKIEKKSIVSSILKKVGLSDLSNRYPTQLSGGQAQRGSIARAVATNPDVLLMDEPFAACDHHTREKLQEWLLDVWMDFRMTVIFVTHSIEEAIYLSDKVIVLNNRKFEAEIKISFPRPRSGEIRFSNDFQAIKHQILERM